MAKGKKGTTKVGMPWWKQSTEEVLTNQNLRSCFPKGKWLEGLGLYITLKALVTAQYESERKDCTTFEVRHTYLLGLSEHSITQETVEIYLQSMLKKKVIENLEVDDEKSVIRLDKIKDELDNWSARQESAKAKSEEVVNKANDEIATPFDDVPKESNSEVTTEKLHPTGHNNNIDSNTTNTTTSTGTVTATGTVTERLDINSNIGSQFEWKVFDSDSSIIKLRHTRLGDEFWITDSDLIDDQSKSLEEKYKTQFSRNFKAKNTSKAKENRKFIAG